MNWAAKYRPGSWEQVVGHEKAVKSLQTLAKEGRAAAVLLVGPSGVGKTTLARIFARAVGCDPYGIVEMDAASRSGVDDVRALCDIATAGSLGASARAFIVDECHALSRQAWQALLRAIEEPPPGLWWLLCTTEYAKVPDTIRTRCAVYHLRPLEDEDIMAVLRRVVDGEGLDVPDEQLRHIVRRAGGSPRQAIQLLARTAGVEDPGDLPAGPDLLKLAKALLRGRASWLHAKAVLEQVDDPEEVRSLLRWYTYGALRRSGESDVPRYLQMLEALGQPCRDRADLALVLGRLIYGVQA